MDLALDNLQRLICHKTQPTNQSIQFNIQERWSKYYLNVVFPKAVSAIISFYKNTKLMVCSPDGDTDFFNIVTGVLQGDILALYWFILSLDYVLQTSIVLIKEKCFTLKKSINRRYSTKTDAGCINDIALLGNTPTQAEILLHSLEQAARGIGFYVNANKAEFMF